MPTKRAFKLFRVRKDGSIGSLFIDTRQRYALGIWMFAKYVPTEGYKFRPGWHSMEMPFAPHLSIKGRAWYIVEIYNYTEEVRPHSQGGLWYLSNHLKIVRPLTLEEAIHTVNYEEKYAR